MRKSNDYRSRLALPAVAFTCCLGVVACSNGGNEGAGRSDATEGRQAAAGSATLTVGDDTYGFDHVRCAFGPDETGREDTEFVLSTIQDGMQLDATVHTRFGHVVTLDDVEDFENPRVDWSAGEVGRVTGDIAEILRFDGKRVSATAGFTDGITGATADGTLTAVCP
jgi:hypothetical protein